MVTKSDYGDSAVQACLSVMVELMTVLGEFRDGMVLVGGWVPYFLFPEDQKNHIGSLDIDIAFDFNKIPVDSYGTILKLLEKQGYVQSDKQPFIFYRSVKDKDGVPIKIEIDLLSGEYGGTKKSHRTQTIQDVKARKARGSDLAFSINSSTKLRATMPDGAINEVKVTIPGAVPFLVMKGMAMWDTIREKHAYDIYFSIEHFEGGIDALVKEFQPHKSRSLVKEGLGKIRNLFESIDSQGPVGVANFLEIHDGDERAQLIRDVFEKVNTLMDSLGIDPFSD